MRRLAAGVCHSGYQQAAILSPATSVWRGLEINGAPNLQPNVEGSIGGFAIGFWCSYAFAERGSTDELDFYAGYTISIESAGDFGLLFTDYYFTTGHRLSDVSDTSAHFLEAAVSYSGPSSILISIFLGCTFKPASVKSLYWEVGYSTSIDAFGSDIFVGGIDGELLNIMDQQNLPL